MIKIYESGKILRPLFLAIIFNDLSDIVDE